MEIKSNQFELLREYAEKRRKELSDLLEPYVSVTDNYGRLLCNLSKALGRNKPISLQDRVLRDLLSDVFDFLYEARDLIISAKTNIAFPVIRRAYESLSLLALCTIDGKYAEKWSNGKEIKNFEIRQELSKHDLGENENDTKSIYEFFSKTSHPNRCIIPERYLGEGNEFVFGSIGMPDPVLATDYCMKHLSLWFWFGAVVSSFYSKNIPILDVNYGKNYLNVANQAKIVSDWLTKSYNHLLTNGNDI